MLRPRGDPREHRAFERMYRRHVRDVYRYASAVLANPTDAEDVAQTVFLNAYRAYQTGTRPDEPLNWLIAITHNVCRQRFRDGSRRPREVLLDPQLVAGPADDGDPFRREDILRALSQLSLNQRAALAMRELEGRSYGEIASVLGTTKTAVETLLFRARRAFREQLEGSLTCDEAERAISLQLDGMLPRADRGSLRAHLRACPECASLARRHRAQVSALRGLVLGPLPPALAGGFGASGGVTVGTAVGLKALAVGTAAVVAAGVGTEVAVHSRGKQAPPPTKRPARVAAAPSWPSSSLVSAHVVLSTMPSPVSEPVAAGAAGSLLPSASRSTRSPNRPSRVAVAPAAATAPAVGSVETPEATTARASTAARQQPQLPGGGFSRRPDAAAVDPHGPPQGQALGHSSQGGASNSADPTHPVRPDHPVHPLHPEHPEHPEHAVTGNDAPAAVPASEGALPPAPATEPTPTVQDATEPTPTAQDVSAPPAADPAASSPPSAAPGKTKAAGDPPGHAGNQKGS
jgi:RNA polymerase sigma-70 factor, ECF subfamily